MLLDPSRSLQRLLRRAVARLKPRPRTLQAAPPVVRLPDTHVEAAKTLVDLPAFSNPKILNRIDGVDTEGCHPGLRDFYRAFQRELRRRGIPMIATEFLRTPERQRELKRQGRSKAGPGQSPHQYGLAFDLVSATRYWDLTPRQWAVIGAIGKEVARKRKLPVEWGGDWPTFWDPAHWQLAGWKAYKALIDAEDLGQPSPEMWAVLDARVAASRKGGS